MTVIIREAFWAAPIPTWERRGIAAVTLLAMSVLILTRLGTYALWDDEANTALYGEAVWRTGDTSAIHGDNVLAYRDGVELDAQLRNRLVAPLPYFVEAPFVRETASPYWARLPFALAGLATIGLALLWLGRTQASRRTWALTALAIVGNVSFILYSRQARYYALAMLLTVALAYSYARRERGWRMLACMSAAGVALLATHYLCYAGMAVALGCDYLIWGRKEARISNRSLVAVLGSQLLVGLPIVLTWFPLGKEIARSSSDSWLSGRYHLWLHTLRDLNACELGVGLLMIAAPLLYRRTRDSLLHRLPLGILVATLVVTVFSPQPGGAPIADIRYVSFLIPACVLLSVRALDAIRLPGALSLLAGIVAFQTNALHWIINRPLEVPGYELPVRSTLLAYIGELREPPASAYRVAASWINQNTLAGQTAVVVPDFAVSPLMFHAPRLVYGWQLSPQRAAGYPALPPIHVAGKIAPDWIIVFGGYLQPASIETLEASYTRFAVLPVTGVDATRPELFLHRFEALPFRPRAPLTIWRRGTP